MRYERDLDSDSLYVQITEAEPVSQVELPSGLVVDLDADGRLRGVEVLRVSAGWDAEEVLREFPVDPADAASLRYLAGLPALMVERGPVRAGSYEVDESASVSPNPATNRIDESNFCAA